MANDELLGALSALVLRGNELTSDLLAHLAELDERQLHLELGFPSLFAYCVESLRLSESAAGRRIAAARLCRKFPEAFALVAQGELHLSALCALAAHLTRENVGELLRASARKSRRQVDELLASRFPRADVREQVRRLPKRAGALKVERARGVIEPLSTERFGFHFTGSARLKEKIERARALARHRLPDGDLAALVELAVDGLIRELEKQRFCTGGKVRRVPLPPGESAAQVKALAGGSEFRGTASNSTGAKSSTEAKRKQRGRHVPAAVVREVYARDGAQCAFVAPDGRRCTAREFLELDHEQPWAANLRLRCRAHNQWHARRYFGRSSIEVAVTRAREGSAPKSVAP